jgi:hypothetical protein
MTLLRSRMRIPLSSNVAQFIMVVLLLTFVALGAVMSISIALSYTFHNGYTLALNNYPSFMSLHANYSSTNHCSALSSSSNF